jgi:dihydroflavonol-4-reductase
MSGRVLITGGTGFGGSHAVERYLSAGWTLRALVRNPQKRRWLRGLQVEIAEGRLGDDESLQRAVEGCDLVVHCAAVTKVMDTAELFKTNATDVESFARAARNAGVQRFILCSSQAAAGPSENGGPAHEDDPPRPISLYGKSKLEGEQRLQANAGSMQWVVLRPPAVIGPRDEQFLPLFRSVMRYGLYPVFGAGRQRYSFVGIHDLSRALLMAGETTTGLNATYFVAHDDAIDWADAARTLGRIAGRRVHGLRLGRPLLVVVSSLAEFSARVRGKSALLTRDKIREILSAGWLCSSEKIRRTWGFRCAWSLEDTLRDTLQSYREMGWL